MTSSDSAPGPAPRLVGSSPLEGVFAFLFLTAFIFVVALVPIRSDNDCWWHVKSGWYIANFGLPTHDVFSYTAADHEWHNHEWLTQVLMHYAFEFGEATGFGGWRAVIGATGIVVWLGYSLLFFLAAKISRNWWIALLIAIMAVAVGRRLFYPRPPVVTNLLLAAELWILIGVAEGWFRRGWAFVLVPMIALWTNLHGGWMAGGVILAAFAVDHVWSAHRHRLPALPFDPSPRPLPIKFLAVLLPLCLLATLANPYGWRLYELPARVMGDRNLVQSIGELAPPNLYFVVDFELIVIGALVLALFLRSSRPRLGELLIFLFFLHQAFQHVRHLSLFSVVMVPVYARLMAAAVEEAHAALPRLRAELLLRAAFIGAIAFGYWVLMNPRETGTLTRPFAPGTYFSRFMEYAKGRGYNREAFPTRVCNLIELAEPRGRMFNENYYAGYLIWRLSPQKHLVYSDPRFDIFGGEILREEQAIASGAVRQVHDPRAEFFQRLVEERPLFEALLEQREVQWLIARGESGLGRQLIAGATEGRWALAAHWPEVGSYQPHAGWQIWVRNTPENQDFLGRFRSYAPLEGAVPGS